VLSNVLLCCFQESPQAEEFFNHEDKVGLSQHFPHGLIASQLVASPVWCAGVLLCCFQESPEACAKGSSSFHSASAGLICGCSP
jgi:hypothetical protein